MFYLLPPAHTGTNILFDRDLVKSITVQQLPAKKKGWKCKHWKCTLRSNCRLAWFNRCNKKVFYWFVRLFKNEHYISITNNCIFMRHKKNICRSTTIRLSIDKWLNGRRKKIKRQNKKNVINKITIFDSICSPSFGNQIEKTNKKQ